MDMHIIRDTVVAKNDVQLQKIDIYALCMNVTLKMPYILHANIACMMHYSLLLRGSLAKITFIETQMITKRRSTNFIYQSLFSEHFVFYAFCNNKKTHIF